MSSMRLVPLSNRSRRARAPLAAWLLVASAAAFGQTAPAVSTVFAFNGSVANGGIVQLVPGGPLYGTASSNTVVSGGLIYQSAVNGSSVKSLHQFSVNEGYAPSSGLLEGSDGLLYGATRLGTPTVANTTGTIYRMASDGTGFTILQSFAVFTETNVNNSPINADGAYPQSALIEGSDTYPYLYGATSAGGLNGTGVIFVIHRDGAGFAVLHDFGKVSSQANEGVVKNPDGAYPVGSLVQASDGYLYGTAPAGGAFGRGTIYRIRMDGTGFEVVHEFTALSTDNPPVNVDGAAPGPGLTDGGDGFLYGVAISGGANGVGTLFVVDPNSEDPTTADPNDKLLTVLHNFDAPDGAGPSGALIVGVGLDSSKLYGVTRGGGTNSSGTTTDLGTIYSFDRGGTGFSKLHSFDGSQGSSPFGPLLQLDETTFVGITARGGACGQGTLFHYSSTGATVTGNTTCGQKKQNKSGGGALAPGLLLLFGALGLAPRRRRD